MEDNKRTSILIRDIEGSYYVDIDSKDVYIGKVISSSDVWTDYAIGKIVGFIWVLPIIGGVWINYYYPYILIKIFVFLFLAVWGASFTVFLVYSFEKRVAKQKLSILYEILPDENNEKRERIFENLKEKYYLGIFLMILGILMVIGSSILYFSVTNSGMKILVAIFCSSSLLLFFPIYRHLKYKSIMEAIK
jgi:hypothetical protein